MTNSNATIAAPANSARASWWLILLMGVLVALMGLFAMLKPLSFGVTLVWLTGVLAVAEGVVGLVALMRGNHPVSRGWLAFYALVSLVFGVMAMLNPASMAEALVMVSALWFVLAGVLRIVWAVRVRKEIDHEWMLILSGIIAIALGVLMLSTPVAGLVAMMVWIGVGALLYGLLQIYVALRLRKLLRSTQVA